MLAQSSVAILVLVALVGCRDNNFSGESNKAQSAAIEANAGVSAKATADQIARTTADDEEVIVIGEPIDPENTTGNNNTPDNPGQSKENSGKGTDSMKGETETGETPVDPGKVNGGTVVIEKPTEIDTIALNKCQEAWGQKFPGDLSKVRKITASVAVLGGGVIVDSRTTAEPELTMVLASVNVLSQMKWQLQNPNGWYCMVANVNVLSSLTVEVSKTAHLADSRVSVNVLSGNSSGLGQANVNVLSNVKVIRN